MRPKEGQVLEIKPQKLAQRTFSKGFLLLLVQHVEPDILVVGRSLDEIVYVSLADLVHDTTLYELVYDWVVPLLSQLLAFDSGKVEDLCELLSLYLVVLGVRIE